MPLRNGLGVYRVIFAVHDLNGRCERISVARACDFNFDNRVGNVRRVGIVRDQKGHVNGKSEIFLDVAHHIGGRGPGDAGLVANGGVIVGTHGQVNERQTHNVPFVEIGAGAAQRFAVHAGKDAHVTIGHNVTGCEDTGTVHNVVGIVEHFVVVFQTLVDIVINVVFGHLAYKGIEARAERNSIRAFQGI